jgi:hypothetical protein
MEPIISEIRNKKAKVNIRFREPNINCVRFHPNKGYKNPLLLAENVKIIT